MTIVNLHGHMHATAQSVRWGLQTELCRTWAATGQCRYGGKCQFAHGFHELRPVQRHPKYRTEVSFAVFQTSCSLLASEPCKVLWLL